MKRALILALVGVLLEGSGTAGIYTPPPADFAPVWSPDGSVIAYFTQRRSGALGVVNQDGTGDRLVQALPQNAAFKFSPSWSLLAYWDYLAGGLVVMRPEIGERRVVFTSTSSTTFDWAPDGRALALAGADGLQILSLEDGSLTKLAERALWPAWSPDGSRIAYVTGPPGPTEMFVVPARGGAPRDVTQQTASVGPGVWSPDGTRLAFATRRDDQAFVEVVRLADGSSQRFEGHGGGIQWSPDGTELLLSGEGVVRLDLASGRLATVARSGNGAVWSPDGTRIAYAAAAECKDRVGIYVAATTGSSHRLTQDCRVLGTTGDDTLTGTPLADLIYGLEGNDTLIVRDDGYVGDDVFGGPGNDRLVGGSRPNLLDGGPGADSVRGGPGWDVLAGGPGRDRLDGEGARDILLAADGNRDQVSCGTNAARTTDAGHENDYAYADVVDTVARDCEVVHRAPRAIRGTSLTITTWPRGIFRAARTRTLRCSPAGGTLRGAATACRQLDDVEDQLAAGDYCSGTFDGRSAFISGVHRGRRVWVHLHLVGPCDRTRVERLAFLLGP